MAKSSIILGILCFVNVCWSTQASKPADTTPFPCSEEVKTPLIDSSVAFYASTPMECQMKSINMKAYANVWADIGVCFPLFDKIYENLPGPVVLNSNHWCFDKHSTNASPVFHETLAMKRVNGIGKKKNIGNKKEDKPKNKNKKKKQNMRNRKKDTGHGGQDTNDRNLQHSLSEFSQITDYSVAFPYEPIELEELASMTLYLQTNDLYKFQEVPLQTIDHWFYDHGIDFRPPPPPDKMSDEELALGIVTIIVGMSG
jgi:hypothetical protein